MFIRTFVVALTVATLWWSSSSFGLGIGLGELNVNSNLASPLKASVTLRGMDGIDLDPQFFSIQIDSDSTSKIEYRLQRMDADTAVIDLYTREIVSDPLFQFRIEVKWDNSTVSRNYDVLVDPPIYQELIRAAEASETGEASIPDAGQAGEKNDLPLQLPIAFSDVVSGDTELIDAEPVGIVESGWSPSVSTQSTAGNSIIEPRREYGPTISGNSIWRVARAVATDNGELTIYQWMYAVWKVNPQAFTGDNMHRLNMDEVLSIPFQDEVAATAHLAAWRAYSHQMSMLQENSLAAAATTVDASVETVQQDVSQKEAAQEGVEQQVGQNISSNVALVEGNVLASEQEFEASVAENSMITVAENSASDIDQKFVVARVNDPVITTPQETLFIEPGTEVETQQTVGTNDPIEAPVVIVSQFDETGSSAEVSNEISDVQNPLVAVATDNMPSTNVVQEEMITGTASMPDTTDDPELNEWSAALLSRHEFIDQLPVIGGEGVLAFVGRAIQHADRYIATSPSWATLGLGVWATLVLMMLRQQLLARRAADGATRLPTAEPISKIVARAANRRKSDVHKAVQSATKTASEEQLDLTSEEQLESADQAVSKSQLQHREPSSNAPEIIAQANAILSQGDLEEAIKLMRLAVVLQPDQPSLVMLLLELYHKTDRAVFFAELLDNSRSVIEMLEDSDLVRLSSMHAQLCPDLPFVFQLDETTDNYEPPGGDSSARSSESDPDYSHIDDDPDDETFLETQVIFTNNGFPLRDEARSIPSMVGDNIDLDAILDEADVYLAYGLNDNAEELLLKGLEVDPDRADFLARLLDSYFASRNVVDFVSCAEKMLGMGDAGSEYREKVEIMGFELAPYNRLFAGGKDGNLKAAELELARPQAADFDLSDIAEFDNAASTDIESEESNETDLADIELYESEGDDAELSDLNLDMDADEIACSIDDDIGDLGSDLDATDINLETVFSENLVSTQDELEAVYALEIDDDDEEIILDFEDEEDMQFTMDDDVEPGQDTIADGDDASLVLAEEATLDSLTSVNLDSSNSRILYFPDISSEGKDIEEFESEVKLTLQAIRDQLQNMTERLFHQERATNDLKQTLAELNDDSRSPTGKKSKKSH